MKEHQSEVNTYCRNVLKSLDHCKAEKEAVKRYQTLKKKKGIYFDVTKANIAVNMIEGLIKHEKGVLKGKPLILQSWQKFIIFNLFGFYVDREFSELDENNKTVTVNKRVLMYTDALIIIPRKNGKTTLAGAIAFVHSLFLRNTGAEAWFVAPSLKQAKICFNFIKENAEMMGGADDGFRIVDNNQQALVERKFSNNGSMLFEATASDVKRTDGFNKTIVVTDEMHKYTKSEIFTTAAESVASREEHLVLGITTAGTIIEGFLHKRYKLMRQKLMNNILDDFEFVFICEKDEDVDWDSERAWKQANPNYGISVTKSYLENKAKASIADLTERQSFLTKHLNVFTNQAESYFDYQKVKASNAATIITLEEAKNLGVQWVGGIDMSESGDLTAACLYTRKDGIDYVISHGFMPLHKATLKASTDGIPYGEYEDNDWLTLTPTETIDHEAIIKWFVDMRKQGFPIKIIGFDAYGMYATDILDTLKKYRFKMVEIRQWSTHRTSAFREVEDKIEKKQFCYFGNELFEYCISNVSAKELSNKNIEFDKISANRRIDLFDCAVTALKALNDSRKKKMRG